MSEGGWAAVRQAVLSRTAELRLSVADLARKAGLSQSTIRRFATTSSTTYETIWAIERGLGWECGHIMGIYYDKPAAGMSPAEGRRVMSDVKLDAILRRLHVLETRLAIIQRGTVIIFERIAGDQLPPGWLIHDDERAILTAED